MENIGANGEGKAYLSVTFAEQARVETRFTAFADQFDNTLIPESSPFFSTILPLKAGDVVKFSAKFLRGRDTCLQQGNLTDIFYSIDPEFIVRFTNVELNK